MTHLIRTIDAHVGGQPLRLVIEGGRSPSGSSLAARAEWLRRHADVVRTALVLEPRGHMDMVAAQFVDPLTPGAHAGVIFMDDGGYQRISIDGIVAAATIAIERSLLYSRDGAEGDTRLVFETLHGPVQARARIARGTTHSRVDTVAVTGLPAFVHTPGHLVQLGSRALRVDVAFGGMFYAIADTEAVGVPLTRARLPELRRLAVDLTRAVNQTLTVTHPTVRRTAVGGVVFTGPAQDPEAQLRTVAVSGSGAVNWSAGGAAASAVMSVLDAMGLLPDAAPFVPEGLTGATMRARVVGRTAVGEHPAIVTEIEASAWITGEHVFHLDADDPYREGIPAGVQT